MSQILGWDYGIFANLLAGKRGGGGGWAGAKQCLSILRWGCEHPTWLWDAIGAVGPWVGVFSPPPAPYLL